MLLLLPFAAATWVVVALFADVVDVDDVVAAATIDVIVR